MLPECGASGFSQPTIAGSAPVSLLADRVTHLQLAQFRPEDLASLLGRREIHKNIIREERTGFQSSMRSFHNHEWSFLGRPTHSY